MNKRIRESGGHWWELLNGTTRFGFSIDADGRRIYGLIVDGKLVCTLHDRWGGYCIGYYLYHPVEVDADALVQIHRTIKACRKAKEQTVPGAMEEAETAYLSYLTERRDYYAGLWGNYTGQPVNADAAPVVHAKWISKRDGDPGECSHCHDFWDAEFDNADYYGTWLTFPEYCPWCGAKMDGG